MPLSPRQTARPSGRLSDRQPRQQPAADRLGRRLSGRPRHHRAPALERGPDQGRALCPCRPRGRRAASCCPGHTDVVPVDGQTWTIRPLDRDRTRRPALRPRHLRHEGVRRAGPCGAGRCAAQGVRRPLQIALSYDEEVGCTGAPPMIAEMRRAPAPRQRRDRGRAVADAGGHRPQGRHRLQGACEGLRGAFLADAIRASARSWRRRR